MKISYSNFAQYDFGFNWSRFEMIIFRDKNGKIHFYSEYYGLFL